MCASELTPGQPQVCTVAYRIKDGRVEFCLASTYGDSRWEFPRGYVQEGETGPDAAVRAANEFLGLNGKVEDEEVLDRFGTEREGQLHITEAFLMIVSSELSEWPPSSKRRRRWCLAEEARIRIRRKPLRRLLDLALRRLEERKDKPAS